MKFADFLIPETIGEAREAGLSETHLGFYVENTIADMNVIGLTRYWRNLSERLA